MGGSDSEIAMAIYRKRPTVAGLRRGDKNNSKLERSEFCCRGMGNYHVWRGAENCQLGFLQGGFVTYLNAVSQAIQWH